MAVQALYSRFNEVKNFKCKVWSINDSAKTAGNCTMNQGFDFFVCNLQPCIIMIVIAKRTL